MHFTLIAPNLSLKVLTKRSRKESLLTVYDLTFWSLRCLHHNFQTASFLMALERYAQQLSNCFPLDDSRDIYTATFKLLSSKWLLRDMHRNFQTASPLTTLEIYTPQLLKCFPLNNSWEMCTTTFKLLSSKWLLRYAHRNFKLLSSKWLLRDVHCNLQTASP